MEEIKELVSLLDRLPNFALWVIAAFWAYKVVFIGSVYGVIRFAIDKLHSWATKPKHELVDLRATIDGMCIKGQPERLIAQLRRLHGKGTGILSEYIHAQSVDWLREAIDEKIARESAKG